MPKPIPLFVHIFCSNCVLDAEPSLTVGELKHAIKKKNRSLDYDPDTLDIKFKGSLLSDDLTIGDMIKQFDVDLDMHDSISRVQVSATVDKERKAAKAAARLAAIENDPTRPQMQIPIFEHVMRCVVGDTEAQDGATTQITITRADKLLRVPIYIKNDSRICDLLKDLAEMKDVLQLETPTAYRQGYLDRIQGLRPVRTDGQDDADVLTSHGPYPRQAELAGPVMPN
eukprot:NODE_7235_length_781_cov_113.275076_g6995_i0.p1 GENE.NODE_7235_length_781_cov_113.275076_g6995_i0~~NODE_7235_length_781_cov_113.275076_g6995_i0.p1  ORF type:complete len:244 (-),score=55.87 NODE_7235_length_781_cov_113.275076_g6995_i0:48-728(-)